MTSAVRSQRDGLWQLGETGVRIDFEVDRVLGQRAVSRRIVAALDIFDTEVVAVLFEVLLQLLAVVEEMDARAAITVIGVVRY